MLKARDHRHRFDLLKDSPSAAPEVELAWMSLQVDAGHVPSRAGRWAGLDDMELTGKPGSRSRWEHRWI
ncbi:hypothetical protein SH661x_001004 [Planctomicrobium sp. SH661]|uniref:hypothetical protein n=1 Tax=Planctomicrobium sp. SH661 TaxID=3448124 RepID=UPI003F5B11E8